MRTKPLLIAGCALALALPALAQQAGQPQPVQPAPAPVQANVVSPAPSTPLTSSPGATDTSVSELTLEQLPPPPPPIEYPTHARRDPSVVGRLDPVEIGLGPNPWGTANGTFMSSLMRRMDTPIASRWAHIALRNALLAKARAPNGVNPVDWVAERAWLLLRLGEADAARMLIADVDSDRFTPKMTQVGVQSALANADPPALCPLQPGIRKYDPGIRALVSAMCASLSGEPESASAQVDDARRHGRIGGIDLTLAEKVVGAGADTGRAVTIEWDPVDRLTAWRFGLSAATGMIPPDRLIKDASPQLRAFQARAPLLSADQRLDSARIAAGLGVFSSQSMIDLYSAIYDSTDSSDLAGTDAWQIRQAFVGKDRDAKLAAIRRLLDGAKDPLQREATRALLGRAAALILPDPDLEKDAPELISAMLAAGYDRAAQRWGAAVRKMDGDAADRCWAMLALASADPQGLDLSGSRINSFIGRDKSPGKVRSALLVGGLAGLGRISVDAAQNLSRRNGLGLGRQSVWTRMIDAAAGRGQPASVLVLAGTGLQTRDFLGIPGAHMYHIVSGLIRTRQDYTARMIAAEALSRT
ncbi:MAG TPA: hypothetical protein VIZ66_02240 [Sphingomicrobium sp.]